MKLTRRNFIRLGLITLTNFSLASCSSKENSENVRNVDREDRQEDNIEKYSQGWVATGGEKIFEEGQHVITKYVSFNSEYENNQVEVPKGYRLFSSEEVITSCEITKENTLDKDTPQMNTYTSGINYMFVNEVKVKAKEYKWKQKGESKYPFAGKVIEKVLKKEVK